jgi:hypothetical protein
LAVVLSMAWPSPTSARQSIKQPTPNAASGPRPRALDSGAARVLELA